jgi:hypothetical protein
LWAPKWEALICKALPALRAGYQQSYPQAFWMTFKRQLNQQLKGITLSSHQLLPLVVA